MRETPVRGPAVDLSEFERRMRGGEAKPAGKADPLSELARLMEGQPEAADPYSQILPDPRAAASRAPAAPPPKPAAPSWEDELRGSFAAINDLPPPPRRPEPPRAPQPEPDYAPQDYHPQQQDYRGYDYGKQESDAYGDQGQGQQHYADDGYAEQQYDQTYHGGAEGSWGDDSQYLDYGAEEAQEPEEGGGLRRYLRPWHAVAAISVIAVGSIAWGFLHRSGSTDSKEIAVIEAPEGPVKVKPTAQADDGAPDASGAAVLDRKETAAVKQVVTHQEQAIDPTVAPKTVKLGDGPVDAPHDPPLAGSQPKRVKTVTVRPDGSRVDDAGLPPAVAKSAAPPADPAATRGGTPKAETKNATTTGAKPKPAPKVAAVEPPAADDAAAAPTASASGGYAVQFGAANSEEEARALLKTVASKYGVKPTFKPAKVGDKTVYRVRVAGVSKDSANAICNKVKAAGGSCFVAGN